tara:strand:- start:28 stop:243 length:216 start_codon:yes stop_codon:yes gene_type:complete
MRHNTDNDVGEWPLYDFETKPTNAKLTKGIRRKVLGGEWPAENRREDQMIRDFKASGLSVDEYLKRGLDKI